MLTYTVEHNTGLEPFVHKTLFVEGKADANQWEKLKMIFFDALNSSDHLIVNIRNVEVCDYSFIVLICSIRRTAQLLGKRLTIEGKDADSFACVYECELHALNKGDMFTLNTPCHLWESSARSIQGSPGAWKKRLARRKFVQKR